MGFSAYLAANKGKTIAVRGFVSRLGYTANPKNGHTWYPAERGVSVRTFSTCIEVVKNQAGEIIAEHLWCPGIRWGGFIGQDIIVYGTVVEYARGKFGFLAVSFASVNQLKIDGAGNIQLDRKSPLVEARFTVRDLAARIQLAKVSNGVDIDGITHVSLIDGQKIDRASFIGKHHTLTDTEIAGIDRLVKDGLIGADWLAVRSNSIR